MSKPSISSDSIQVKASAANWEAAVEKVGELLKRQGLVEERYTPAMVEAVRKLGPYIVLAPGIAFPHARPEDGAIGTGIGLLTLSEPVAFGNVDNDPVDIVIGLASVDNTSHINLLSQLCEFLEDSDNVDRLRSATERDTIASLINRYGKEEEVQ